MGNLSNRLPEDIHQLLDVLSEVNLEAEKVDDPIPPCVRVDRNGLQSGLLNEAKLSDIEHSIVHHSCRVKKVLQFPTGERYPFLPPDLASLLLCILQDVYSRPSFQISYSAFVAVSQPPDGLFDSDTDLYQRAHFVVQLPNNPDMDELFRDIDVTPANRGDSSLGHDYESPSDEDTISTDESVDEYSDSVRRFLKADVIIDDDDVSSISPSPESPGHMGQLIHSAGSDETQGGAGLCIGEEEKLLELLTSALYHRLVVGMRGPVIGLGIDHTWTARAVLAWTDDNNVTEGSLPSIQTASPQNAVFKLSDSADARRLHSFLARTKDHIVKTLETCNVRHADWRADAKTCFQSKQSFNRYSNVHFKADILAWAQAVFEADSSADAADLKSDSTHWTSSSLERKDETFRMPQVNLSASTFVTAKLDTDFRLYFVHRVAVSLERDYCRRLKYTFPDDLLHVVRQPSLDLNFVKSAGVCQNTRRLRQELIESMKNLPSDELLGDSRVEEVVKIVPTIICDILHACKLARKLMDSSYNQVQCEKDDTTCQPVNEANFRVPFDLLASSVSVACQSEGKSVFYEQEANLKFSQNPLDRNPDSDTICYSMWCHFQPFGSVPKKDHWFNLINDQWKVAVDREPTTGQSDGVLFASISEVFDHTSDPQNISIWTPATSDATRLQPASPAKCIAIQPESRNIQEDLYNAPISTEWEAEDMINLKPASSTRLSTEDLCNELKSLDMLTPGCGQRTTLKVSSFFPPILLIESKKHAKGIDETTKLLKMAMTAALMNLADLNIGNYPIIGVTTDRCNANVHCGWIERQQNTDGESINVILFSENIIERLDISRPIDALHFSIILINTICDQTSRLGKLFEAVDSCQLLDNSVQKFILENAKPPPYQCARACAVKGAKSTFKQKTYHSNAPSTSLGSVPEY